MLGKVLGARRKEVLIATKVYNSFGILPNALGTSCLAIRREVEDSLRLLGIDWINLYQVHQGSIHRNQAHSQKPHRGIQGRISWNRCRDLHGKPWRVRNRRQRPWRKTMMRCSESPTEEKNEYDI